MDIRVGLSIYNKSWLIEPQVGVMLLDMWEKAIASGQAFNPRAFDDGEDAERSQRESQRINALLSSQDGVIIAPINKWEAKDFTGFDGASTVVLRIDGPLMKADFCGWFGTEKLAGLIKLADKTPSVKSIVLLIDSPGGTVDGTAQFAESIRNAKKSTVALVNGTCASAAYWIGSAADEIYITSKTDIVGSIGTMASWYNYSKAYEEMGIVLRYYTATKSVDKNKAMMEADNGDGRMLIQETLDPLNNEFLAAVSRHRAGKINLQQEDVFTGKTYVGLKAQRVGLVDGITTIDKAISRSIKISSQKNLKSMEQATPFSRVLAAANTTAFEVVDGGFLATEEQLRGVESTLEQNENTIQERDQTISQQSQQIEQLQQQLADEKATVTGLTNQVQQMKASAPDIKQSITGNPDKLDKTPNAEEKYLTSVDAEMAKLRALKDK